MCTHTHAYCKLVFLELTNSLTKDILYDLSSCVVKCSKADQLLLTEWVVLVYRTTAHSKKIMAFGFIEKVFLDIISIPSFLSYLSTPTYFKSWEILNSYRLVMNKFSNSAEN